MKKPWKSKSIVGIKGCAPCAAVISRARDELKSANGYILSASFKKAKVSENILEPSAPSLLVASTAEV